MSKFKLLWSALLAIGLVGSVNFVRAQNEDKPAEKNQKEQESKEELSPADEKLQEIISSYQELAGQVREAQKDDSFAKTVTPKIKMLLKSSDELVGMDGANERHKGIAKQIRMSLVGLAAQNDQEFAQELLKENPGTEMAALIEAQLFAQTLREKGPSDDAHKQLTKFAKDYPKSDLAVQLFALYAQRLEGAGETKKAVEVCEQALKLFPNSRFTSRIESTLKMLKMVGTPLDLQGPTLEGSEFTMESMKGKVVLVDFWATWCGPCIAAMPGVHRVYDKYHDRGFEIVGVSLDNSKEELQEFIDEHEMGWPQLIYDDPEKMGWSSPLASKFGVNAIPRMILVGRDGKVVNANIRGEEDIAAAVERELSKSEPVAN